MRNMGQTEKNNPEHDHQWMKTRGTPQPVRSTSGTKTVCVVGLPRSAMRRRDGEVCSVARPGSGSDAQVPDIQELSGLPPGERDRVRVGIRHAVDRLAVISFACPPWVALRYSRQTAGTGLVHAIKRTTRRETPPERIGKNRQ